MTTIRVSNSIHLLGLGCGGSYTAMHIAKKGAQAIACMHGWDGDDVDLGNTQSQTYLDRHVGMKKVDALADQVREWGGFEMVRHPEFITRPVPLSGYVFVAVDSMTTRMQLWEQSIERNAAVHLMIEMRLDTTTAIIHVVDPNNEAHIKRWRHYWYPAEEATTAGDCGATVARGPIASLAASMCVWQMVRAIRIAEGSNDRLDNQIRIEMEPLSIETYQW